jgi:hypothetical protein
MQRSASSQIIAENNHVNDVILQVCTNLYIQAKSKEYNSKKILSLWSPPKNPTIASGVLPSGALVAHPMKYKDKKEKRSQIVLCRLWKKRRWRRIHFWAYTQIFLTIASGATPIGSAGRALDENGKYRLRLEEENHWLRIEANYRLHWQKY